MNEVKSLLGSGDGDDGGSSESGGICPSLSYKQRVWGFGICFALGFVLGFFSTWMLFIDVIVFAVMYTLANILSVGSTIFLMGPVKQIKSMFEKKRIVATLIFLAAMGMTLFSALYVCAYLEFEDRSAQVGLTLLFFIIQWLALIWYSLSYIPFAHRAIVSCCKGICAD